jgi:hypothetical protein
LPQETRAVKKSEIVKMAIRSAYRHNITVISTDFTQI